MASITPVIRPERADSRGRCVVYIRFTAQQKSAYVALPYKVTPRQWSKRTGRVLATNPHADFINEQIDAALLAAMNGAAVVRERGGEVTAQALRAAYDGTESRDNFWGYADQWLAERKRKGQERYYRRARAILRKFEAVLPRPAPWTTITLDTIRAFDTYMEQECGNGANTRNIAYSVLGTIFNKAIREGVIGAGNNPLVRFEKPKPVKKAKVRLTTDELKAMQALRLDGVQALARDVYLTSFLLRGLRVGDVLRLTWDDITSGKVNIVTGKTGAIFRATISGSVLSIISPYAAPGRTHVFPFLEGVEDRPEKIVKAVDRASARLNKAIKIVARKAGVERWESVTIHTARHSFAFAAKKRGVPVLQIMDAMTHTKVATMQEYLEELDGESLEDALVPVYENW